MPGPGLGRSLLDGIGVGIGQHRLVMVAQNSRARQIGEFLLLGDDRAAPAPRPVIGLVLPLQKMSQQDSQAALDLTTVAAGRVAQELPEMVQVEVRQPAPPHEFGHPLEPGGLVGFVELGQ